ncbi:flagellum-specific ATP synthase [Acidomonas methanolica]|nr:flagellum-specific ATP synthase [Acidomonas methanolica]GBQ56838.1 flagellum-specific ATP synthase [Acidomonas methanolica]
MEQMRSLQDIQERMTRFLSIFQDFSLYEARGKVRDVTGLAVSVTGVTPLLSIGDRLTLHCRDEGKVLAEVVGFRGPETLLMTFGPLDGIGPGSAATYDFLPVGLPVDDGWLGRVVDPLGRPMDGRERLGLGRRRRPVRCAPPNATERARLGPRLSLGVRVLDAFTTCREGQRLGLFAGSGVGKSTLLSMLARQASCDVAVIALVGERGREVREFIEDDLGEEGLRRSVVVVATSDTPPLMRREAPYAAMAIAEYFRDQGKSVLLLMDSVTRFCLALREIGLSMGEPPATRGYPPSVFATLPMLLERAGPGVPDEGGKAGSITGLFTVLVEGDDQNEPVADAVRGILDGHVVLDRRIAEQGRYPAVDVLRSLSRSVPGCNTPEENALTRRARGILATYQDMADMIRLGAYKMGGDPLVDEAIEKMPRLERFLSQDRHDVSTLAGAFSDLASIFGTPVP